MYCSNLPLISTTSTTESETVDIINDNDMKNRKLLYQLTATFTVLYMKFIHSMVASFIVCFSFIALFKVNGRILIFLAGLLYV